ncbi:MAG TPA: MBL fold metallo-hydrolase [Methanofastidiosum sp.]|nr:MBL fold metallo-hydrolase [Methanofastidiosum sp.]HQM95135.1 MBL fold metallo-hydrolase [Methanofastidiosum sp.]HQQ49153.1 MBL fold metallo-hydrolase [Methanofastidiosum sp.]HRZ19642.1 MBL fold metallo-hydrolase [Methanofastidiosum sp.]
MTKITFLGSGGGRFMAITQKRGTGGFYVEDRINIHVDPGPGAHLRAIQNDLDPKKTNALLISHCHTDHFNDVPIMIESMTGGMLKKEGCIIGSKSVIEGRDEYASIIFPYYRKNLKSIISLQPKEFFDIKGQRIEALKTKHSDPYGIGFKIFTDSGIISYTSDTEYFNGMEDQYMGSRVMILNVTRPNGDKIPFHLSSDAAVTILEKVKPEVAVITHIGYKMHIKGAEEERKYIEAKSGVKTLIADEGLKIYMNGRLTYQETVK